jgi:hypothetical protein
MIYERHVHVDVLIDWQMPAEMELFTLVNAEQEDNLNFL